jgi:hypothetical protein
MTLSNIKARHKPANIARFCTPGPSVQWGMFGHRPDSRPTIFEDRLGTLRHAGFAVEPAGAARYRVARHGCAALIDTTPAVVHSGVVLGNEVADLVDGGFQKFLATPSARREPALASQLQALHDFEEDLREALGLTSLYNQSLGTTCDHHAYDRLAGR